jgi:hypothetical protein
MLEQENQRLTDHAESLEKANAELEARADKLQTALVALTRKFFGVSSEKASPEQRTDLGSLTRPNSSNWKHGKRLRQSKKRPPKSRSRRSQLGERRAT